MFRIGHGIDVHPFSDDPQRPCVLGGVTIPSSRGFAGHSDADVVIHAICDALLGAAGLPDIGHLFPNTDPKYLNIPSTLLLKEVVLNIRNAGYSVASIDVTILAEVPKISPHITGMKAVLAPVLGVEPSAIGIKATTTEGLGYVGRKEGIEVHAVCLLEEV